MSLFRFGPAAEFDSVFDLARGVDFLNSGTLKPCLLYNLSKSKAKGPKLEIFDSGASTQIRPVSDLGTRQKNKKVMDLA
jgi:hypothetical protein